MISLKAQLSAVFLWLFCSLYNPVYAQNTTNPFTGSQYSDLADLTDWYLAQGGSIDNYFYSEGFSTGSDGELGNEYICIRDDVNKVYVGRSDVCFDRAMDGEGYSYIWVDKQDWSMGFPEDIKLETGDLIADGSTNWSGCFNVYPEGTQIWAGTSGGQCPNMIESGQINYGYVQQTLTNTAAINLALQEAGVEVTGYRYQWNVKNADANMETENNPNSVDPFEVTIKIYDETGKPVFEKTYDYSYWIDTWTTFSGEEKFQNPFDADALSEIQLSITGKDIGFWAGYYGPEFRNPEVNLQYRMKAVPMEDPLAELLFQQQCDLDPLSDIMCPNYQSAMMEQITSSSKVENLSDDMNVSSKPIESPTQEIKDEQIAETISETIKEDSSGQVEQSPEATTENDSIAAETSDEEKSSAGLSANQLLALDIASEATAAAESTVADQANQSASIGLSESGGVSSSLTSDGISNANGTLNDQLFSNNSNGNSNGSTDQSMGDNSLGSNNNEMSSNDTTMQIGSLDITNTTNTNGQNSNQNDLNFGQMDTTMSNGSIENNGDIDLSQLEDTSTDQQLSLGDNPLDNTNNSFDVASLEVDLTDLNSPLAQIINAVTNNIINDAAKIAEEIAEESSEESYEEQNAKEDDLVEQALAGDDSEDAQAALLGYNPQFRAYQSPQLPDNQFYQPKDIYGGQKNYDNPNGRLFNMASDKVHREMVRSQYE
jgi:hypothetical protein